MVIKLRIFTSVEMKNYLDLMISLPPNVGQIFKVDFYRQILYVVYADSQSSQSGPNKK